VGEYQSLFYCDSDGIDEPGPAVRFVGGKAHVMIRIIKPQEH
jgi:hypothetical protein